MPPKKQSEPEVQEQAAPDQEATPPVTTPADPGEVRPFEGEPAPVQEEAGAPGDPGPHAAPTEEADE